MLDCRSLRRTLATRNSRPPLSAAEARLRKSGADDAPWPAAQLPVHACERRDSDPRLEEPLA